MASCGMQPANPTESAELARVAQSVAERSSRILGDVVQKQGDISVTLESTEVDEQTWKVSLALAYPTVPEAKRVFDALSDSGKVTMPFGKTFWAEGFGMLVDRFGTHWMVTGAMATA